MAFTAEKHAHAEASLWALVLVGLAAVLDRFVVDLGDGDPRKILYYILAFWVLYGIGRLVFGRLWNG